MIAARYVGLVVESNQLSGGNIVNISVNPTSLYLNQATSYTFYFTPVSSIDSLIESKIEIALPSTLTFP